MDTSTYNTLIKISRDLRFANILTIVKGFMKLGILVIKNMKKRCFL